MCLVYSHALWLWWRLIFEGVLLVRRWVPESCIVYGRDVQVLRDSSNPCGYALSSVAVIGNYQGDLDLSAWLVIDPEQAAPTLIFESCGMAGCPLTAGSVISKVPNSSFFISCESRFQPSVYC